MATNYSRRDFFKQVGLTGLAASVAPAALAGRRVEAESVAEQGFKISLAQWSLNDKLFSGELDNLDFAAYAKQQFGIDAVEYVNQFFADRAGDEQYIGKMKQRAEDHGVRSLLIMCDKEGRLGDANKQKRLQAVKNHHKWVDAAQQLGCHAIRVNARSAGSRSEQRQLAADGLRRLCEYADNSGINVIVENHGGLSSDGQWLAEVMQTVDHPRVGTLPDFGNFGGRFGGDNPYEGVKAMMPWAKGVSAKSYAFNEQGEETSLDYHRLLKIVLAAGYHGHVGVEYEGDQHGADEGIRLTQALLKRVRDQLVA
jgi:sugar phosphate isomerase/epimerase